VHHEHIFDALENLDTEQFKFEHDWQKGILMSLIDDMLPNRDISGDDAKLEEITDIYDGKQGSKRIANRVQRAIQIEKEPVEVMEDLVEEVREV
jgi:hypothetical protein